VSNSNVLDAFVAATAARDVDRAEPLQRQLEAFQLDADEREIAVRCLTEAAQAWRDALNADNPAEPIDTGTQAFMESEFAEDIVVDAPTEQLKQKLLETLAIASDRLGPIPEGALGHFKAPEATPQIVEEVQPSTQDLVEMAQAAGETVGIAAALGHIDSVAVLRRIAEPSDADATR
jgi:hypothetical protein